MDIYEISRDVLIRRLECLIVKLETLLDGHVVQLRSSAKVRLDPQALLLGHPAAIDGRVLLDAF